MSVIAYHFWSPTCAPCKVIKPAVEDLKEEFPNVQWVSVNTHSDAEDYASKYGVTLVPTIVVTQGGNEVGRHSGTAMITYYSLLRKAVALSKPTY
jgi:thiol-disulfide isomerase/thioredoxin